MPAKRLKELGEQFEKDEDGLFGEEGFEKTIDRVAAVEKQLGIYDLTGFVPMLVPQDPDQIDQLLLLLELGEDEVLSELLVYLARRSDTPTRFLGAWPRVKLPFFGSSRLSLKRQGDLNSSTRGLVTLCVGWSRRPVDLNWLVERSGCS